MLWRAEFMGRKRERTAQPTAYLQRSKTHPKRVSWIWQKAIWWWGSGQEALGNLEYSFIAVTPSNAVVWIASAPTPISNTSKTFGNSSIGITITLMFHSFLSSLARFKYLSLFSFSLILSLLSAEFGHEVWSSYY